MQDMLVNCNSCQKKFVVPDSAITEKGRLLQCGSCGNKWTQYPIQEGQKTIKAPIKTSNTERIVKKSVSAKKTSKSRKREVDLYSEEYLKKKHGLVIKDAISTDSSNSKRKSNTGIGFYGNVIILIIFLVTIFGLLDLNKFLVINKFPFLETYINYLYDSLEIIKISISSLIS
jgi:predicted Zn finger-like uncharacterized protein